MMYIFPTDILNLYNIVALKEMFDLSFHCLNKLVAKIDLLPKLCCLIHIVHCRLNVALTLRRWSSNLYKMYSY